ncbi:hypothetical protein C9374_000335 [Naegleria lovaniensis]|uniref:Uncharacterized protein n=1 Tax=Naegleria lovaniensis TaxID=51637 RepID=A0AA88GZJ6_NAELO|nr:uncharacterized protein C9374_000335 [Naegleria lovaniensis]KAG2388896.1 hypothetical protein C9374_000335 [Naegleria lovaniensis]
MPIPEQSISPELNIHHHKNKSREVSHHYEDTRPHSTTTESEISARPHHSIKEMINPTLREALEALTLNLQTFMKYLDYHEKKNGQNAIFGISTPLNTASTNNSVSISMGTIEKTNAVPSSANYEYLQIDPQCIGDDEIILTEKEYMQLEEIYLNPIKYLSDTLKILNERNQHEDEYRDNITPTPNSSMLQSPVIIQGRARKRNYNN